MDTVEDDQEEIQELVTALGPSDTRLINALQDFRLPFISLRSVALANAAVSTALAVGQGVVLHGPRGSGKSVGVRRAVNAIEARERAALHANPQGHQLQRVLYFKRLTGTTIRENVITVSGRLSPQLARDRQHGSRISVDDMLRRLTREMLQHRYRLVVVDEAEEAPDAVFEFLRRLLGDVAPDDDGAGDGGEATGLGVVVVGTDEAADRLRATPDRNGRWATFFPVERVAPGDVPGVYTSVFPGFAPAIQRMGQEQWMAFIAHRIARGQPASLRQIANHCRLYFAMMHQASLAMPEGQEIVAREEVPFDETRFLYTFTQVNNEGPRPVIGQPRTRRKRGVATVGGAA